MPDTVMNESAAARGPLKNLAIALCKAQAEMEGAAKATTNPHFNRKYADLASVWNTIREPLTKNGLSVVQLLRSVQGGVEVETILLHSSGESISDTFSVPASKQDAQGFGSAATYARRYSLMALVGVAPEDDDGNAASAGAPGSAGGGGDFRPPGPRRPLPPASGNNFVEEARRDGTLDETREKGTMPGKQPPAKKTAADKAKEWTDKAITVLKLPGQHVDSLDNWWREQDKVPAGAKFSPLGWLKEAAPAEYERLEATFDEIRSAAKRVAA